MTHKCPCTGGNGTGIVSINYDNSPEAIVVVDWMLHSEADTALKKIPIIDSGVYCLLVPVNTVLLQLFIYVTV
jgi:hypothetical protein